MMTVTDPAISASAVATLAHIEKTLDRVAVVLGEDSPRYRAMAASWRRASANLWSLMGEGGDRGDGRSASLSRDGDRSLYIVTSYGMHVGCVFFRDRAYQDVACPSPQDGTLPDVSVCVMHDGAPFAPDAVQCAESTRMYPALADTERGKFCFHVRMPWPGEWSLHS